ncbi:MAG: hypothetical protein M3M94_05505 [Actinomycetota bacterium]|nr:hypothetical protein [Actinomycetota bacterium]
MEIRSSQRWWSDTGSPALRDLLWREWDPIGLRDSEAPRDEYDPYVAAVAERLTNMAGRRRRSRWYLHRIRSKEMGLRPNRGATFKPRDR